MTRTRLLLTLLFALATLSVPAQQLESLREEIRQAEEEIKMTNQLLSNAEKPANDRPAAKPDPQ